MDSLEDSIQVFIRIKPGCQDSPLQYTDTQIKLDRHQFGFDRVFPPESQQQDIFHAVGTKLLQNTLDGYNSCIFVYGQTGSGKTHTMIGQDNGIMQKSFEQLFSRINLMKNAQCLVTCSYFQLYNEQIIDLVQPKKQKKLNIRQDAKKGVFVQNLAEETAMDSDRLMEVLYTGMKNRHIGQTQMNRQSSRSHSIFTISLSCKIQQDGKKVLKTPKLHFVDLAGSQRQKLTMASGERLKQAGNINKSLTTLGMVINALTSQKPRSHIPYRDSKLTCLLRDSLGGNSKTIIIATVSGSSLSFQQTLSTLNFANRAKMVKVKALINQQSLSSNIQVYKEQIRKLKTQIMKLRSMEHHKSPFKISVCKNQPQSTNSINIDHHFQQINKKIGAISEQLNQNIMSPSLQALLQNLNKNKSQMTPIAQMCDESEQAFNQKQNVDLIEYLNSNYNLLTSINKKVNEYLQIKQQLRSLAFNKKLAIEEIRTPSKPERDIYQELLKKKQIQLKSMEQQLQNMSVSMLNKQIQNKELSRKIDTIQHDKGYQQKDLQDAKLNYFSIQRQLDFCKINLQKTNNDRARFQKHLTEAQTTLNQTKQLYLYSQQKYQNQKYCKNKLQQKIAQISNKVQVNQRMQRRLQQEINQYKQDIQKLKMEVEQHEAKEQELLNQIEEINQTIQYNKRLFLELTSKFNTSSSTLNQITGKLASCQLQLSELKLIYQKLKFQSQFFVSALTAKNMQLERLNQKFQFQLKHKNQQNQKEKLHRLNQLEQLRQKHNSLLCQQKKKQNENYHLVQELEQHKIDASKSKNNLQHQLSILQMKLSSRQSEFTNIQLRNTQLQNKFQEYVLNTKAQVETLNAKITNIMNQNKIITEANQKLASQLKSCKAEISSYSTLKAQNQQLKKSYKQAIKQNYKLKGKYNSSNQELQKQNNQQLLSKVTYYQQKFKLMSIQYQKITEVVKRLKQKELEQSNKLQYYQENSKLNKLDHQEINDQNSLISELRDQNRDLKNKLDYLQGNMDKQTKNQQNSLQKHKSDQKQRILRNKLQIAILRWEQLSGKDVKTMSTEQLIQIWEQMQKQSKIKFDNIAKGIRRQQKLKSQNNFILKQNIYMRQKLASLQKQQQKPRKLVKTE